MVTLLDLSMVLYLVDRMVGLSELLKAALLECVSGEQLAEQLEKMTAVMMVIQ